VPPREETAQGRQRSRTKVAAALCLALAMIAAAVFIGVSSGGRSAPASAQAPAEIHGGYSATTDSCASCHRSHRASSPGLVAAEESALCLSCHNGTGASTDIASEYSDPTVPADDPNTSAFYTHPATTPSSHVSAQQDEFGGVYNRHSECADCHNPHTVNGAMSQSTASGWTASGALQGSTGVSAMGSLTWKSSVDYEYEVCLKCHSSYTQLPSYAKESYKKTDVAAEMDPAGGSYHPVRAKGTNASPALDISLAGGKLWQFTTGSTIRCTQCHGNYRLVGDPPVSNSPFSNDRLAPHTSQYRSILAAGYRSRELKTASAVNDYGTTDFDLCYLCHSEAPFTDTSGNPRSDTDFQYHGLHVSGIFDKSGGGVLSTDIDTPGAGQGNATCAECHDRPHGTSSAYWASQRSNQRLVSFAPNVEPMAPATEPSWDLASRTCSVRCHGADHSSSSY
jgi:predicted CXXCH cytochrome family protein